MPPPWPAAALVFEIMGAVTVMMSVVGVKLATKQVASTRTPPPFPLSVCAEAMSTLLSVKLTEGNATDAAA